MNSPPPSPVPRLLVLRLFVRLLGHGNSLGLWWRVPRQVLGRNCRFLQGPDTDPKAVEKIRKVGCGGVGDETCRQRAIVLGERVIGVRVASWVVGTLREACLSRRGCRGP